MEEIKSWSFDQNQILRDIINLHTGPIECDVTYGHGCFYKNNGITKPLFCFDIDPCKPEVITADVKHLPMKSGSIQCIIFDPPFMARTGPGAIMKARFGEIIGPIKDLWTFYFLSLKEISRVLKRGGWLIFKCQDGVLSGVNNFTHVKIEEMAGTMGLLAIDFFILLATRRMKHPKQKVQRHARKYHSYFWVFKKV